MSPEMNLPRPRTRSSGRTAESIRRRQVALVALLCLVIGVSISLSLPAGHPKGSDGQAAHRDGPGDSPATTGSASGPPAIEAGLLGWQLNSPLSRSVVLPGAKAGSLIVAGGLQSEGSLQGVYQVSTTTGRADQVGNLLAPLHDAAGVVLDGKGYVFGGGTATPLASTQRLDNLGVASAAGSTARSTQLPPLPQARADSTAVTVGSTAYLVGGYDGSSGDRAVLSTTDGEHFKTVAELPVAVRYPAVASLDGDIYVFGGDATSGPGTGDPVTTVQEVVPQTGTAKIVGALPTAIAGAAAATLGGTIYVAGGEVVPGNRPGANPVAVRTIWAWLPAESHFAVAGHLREAVSHAGLAVLGSRAWLVGGEQTSGTPSLYVQMFEQNSAFGRAGQPGAGSPFYGEKLLIADRGNDRLLLLDDTDKIIWSYPSVGRPAPPGGFYFPDDAFFAKHGTEIISNQEENDTVVEIAYPSGKLLWSYGHPRRPGSAPGYLNSPDDAYLLRDGDITVADPMNCRVVILSSDKTVLDQIGTPGSCAHNPPNELGSPNGDTPLSDGNILVSEINGSWIDEYTTTGHLVWAVQLGIGYPSDPQPLSADRYVVADYETPGAFVEFDRAGHILYRYGPSSGTGELNRPSLVEQLPSGVLMANDDYNDRMMAIDPSTGALVWQYGSTGVAGTAPGLLNIPDGFDILGPGGTTPTHTPTG